MVLGWLGIGVIWCGEYRWKVWPQFMWFDEAFGNAHHDRN
ncbi:hypothetical protein HMPREF0758_1728 [Serratia odorifera DSM 4582]|uniref:Uncharacterized protein n=1 Tax=Serratia odorifera DSM 4582 TaxID=667129 RepID=D4E0M8_SEROD|nr:hypothetical protein HMPREF0758_1728 [Serratia odorifera DSM 4582]